MFLHTTCNRVFSVRILIQSVCDYCAILQRHIIVNAFHRFAQAYVHSTDVVYPWIVLSAF